MARATKQSPSRADTPPKRAHVVKLAIQDREHRPGNDLVQLPDQFPHQRHVVGVPVQRVAHRDRQPAAQVYRHQRLGAQELAGITPRGLEPPGGVLDRLAVADDHLETVEAGGQTCLWRGHQLGQLTGAFPQDRPADRHRHSSKLAIEVALVNRVGVAAFQLDKQLVGAAAMTHQGITHQAEKISESQHVLIAASAMPRVDRIDQGIAENEVAHFQHGCRQRRTPHQFPVKSIHENLHASSQQFIAKQLTCQQERGRGGVNPRSIRGGRPHVRSALYMAAVSGIQHNPVLKAYYRHLTDNGKPPKVALVACMRKLLIHLNSLLAERPDAPTSNAPTSNAPTSNAPTSNAPALDAPALDASKQQTPPHRGGGEKE